MPVLTYLFKLALRPWKLAFFSQAISTAAVALLLFLAGLLSWMQAGLKQVVARLHYEQTVTAYLDPGVAPEKTSELVDSIRLAAGAEAVREIRLTTPTQFVEELRERYPDLSRELRELGPEMDAVAPRYVSVSGVLPEGTLERVRAVPGIESAENSRDRNQALIGAFGAVRWVARALTAGLGVALLSALVLLARSNGEIHREAVALLRVWGSSSARLAAPGVISGWSVGACGGLAAALLWLASTAWLARQIRALSPVLQSLPSAHSKVAILLFLCGCTLGVVAGLIATFGRGPSRSASAWSW